jgi:hypothetical protein
VCACALALVVVVLDDRRRDAADDERDKESGEHANELPLGSGHAAKSTIHGASMPKRRAVSPM